MKKVLSADDFESNFGLYAFGCAHKMILESIPREKEMRVFQL